MSDGTLVRVLSYDPRTTTIADDELIGLTISQARVAGRAKGALIVDEGTGLLEGES
jgi:hypothetical protein